MIEMETIFNKHFIRIRDDGAIIRGFSDAFEQPEPTDILINDQGGYQFRLIIDGIPTEENPLLHNSFGIPIFKFNGEHVTRRTEAEIQADIDALPQPEPMPTPEERLSTMEQTLATMAAAVIISIPDVIALEDLPVEMQKHVKAELDALEVRRR